MTVCEWATNNPRRLHLKKMIPLSARLITTEAYFLGLLIYIFSKSYLKSGTVVLSCSPPGLPVSFARLCGAGL